MSRGVWRPKKDKIKKECKICNKIFYVHNYRKDTAMFCSNACQTKNNGLLNKGKKRSKDICEKISKSLNGRIVSKETIKKLKISHKGQHNSIKTEFKKGQIAWNKGLKLKNSLDEQYVSCQIIDIQENKKLRTSTEYKAWRHDVFSRDWFTCQMPGCGYKGKNIECHHIIRVKDNADFILDINNGITLCKQCHKFIRGKEKEYEDLFKNIIMINKDN